MTCFSLIQKSTRLAKVSGYEVFEPVGLLAGAWERRRIRTEAQWNEQGPVVPALPLFVSS